MKELNAQQLDAMQKERTDLTVIDVLPESSHRQKHIPGSINVPEGADDFVQRAEQAAGSREEPVVVYCASHDCDASPKAARKLEGAGFRQVYDFAGGIASWEQADLPLDGEAVGPGKTGASS